MIIFISSFDGLYPYSANHFLYSSVNSPFISASVKKQTLIQEANDYTASRIPQAEAEAQSLVSTAKTNSSDRQTKASEEVAVFNGLYEQYKASPEVVMNSAFRLRVAEALKKTGATVIVPDGGDGAKVILP